MENPQRQFILALLGYITLRGISSGHLCELAGIEREKLIHATELTLSDVQISKFWRHATVMTADPFFGLHFGESLQLSGLGIVGEIIKSSRCIGDGITHAADMTRLLTHLFEMRITKSSSSFKISFKDGQIDSIDEELKRQTAEFLMAFTLHELDGLTLRRITPVSVTLPHQHGSLCEYQRVLRGRPIEGPYYAIELPITYWNEPILTSNHVMQSWLLQRAALLRDSSPQSFSMAVEMYIQRNAYLGIPSVEDVAANFNITTRTLQRKLKDDHVTFQALSDKIKKSLAIDFLRVKQFPIKEVSALLGYNEVSAFSRAFKRWTGNSPASFKDSSIS